MSKMVVSRSIDIHADPQRVFDVVCDFSRWSEWSPWLCAEPTAKVTVSDDPRAVGATYAWEGELTGAGEIKHERVDSPRRIDMQLQFLKPWKSTAKTSFELNPLGDGTRLTWQMESSWPWFLFWLRAQMQACIGMDYDRGLKMIKVLVETGHIDSRSAIRGTVSIGPLYVAGVRSGCQLKDIEASMQQSIAEANTRLGKAGIPTSGELIAVYHSLRLKDQWFDYTIGYILEAQALPQPGLSVWTLPRSQALRVDHIGNYEFLGNSWSTANMYVRHHKLKQSKVGAFEIYKNNPEELPPAEWLTEIYLPLK